MGRLNARRKALNRKQRWLSEAEEIELLEQWLSAGEPPSGSNPLSFPSLPSDAPVGRTADGSFSAFAGCELFEQLPLSRLTRDGLRPKYTKMSEIQRASLSHSLSGRDVLGAAKTGSGKTLAFVIPVLEKLYCSRWGPEDGVGSIIISPTKELAGQIFEVLKTVGKHHSFSAGLLIGGRKDVAAEKECVNSLNILVCTPGRLLQHMDETPNFDCSQLQVLVLDEADRILDEGFKRELDAIISQLPKSRQTLLFSATQTKSVRDLARLSLKDPEYISVHAESVSATPDSLKQIALEVPLDQKLDMLWSFIKAHLNSKMLVFLSTCKQVKFVFEIFKKLRPGIPLKCLHGRMKQNVRMAIYSQFCKKCSVLFSTDVAARGLDFPSVDWVIQVDCPEDVATYIHRVGRTARFSSKGNSVLFLLPSEKEMMTKLHAAEPKIPIKLGKANMQKLQPTTGAIAAQLVKYPNLQDLAQKAFIRYLRSVYKQKDKEVFDVLKLPTDEFAASLGLATSPKIRFLNRKMKVQNANGGSQREQRMGNSARALPKKHLEVSEFGEEKEEDVLVSKALLHEHGDSGTAVPPTRISKKKKLKINMDRPIGTRFVFDDEGQKLSPLAALADVDERGKISSEKVAMERQQWIMKLRKEMVRVDKEDKLLQKKRLREGRTKEKMKVKKWREEQAGERGDVSESDDEGKNRVPKKLKVYFDSDDDHERTEKENAVISANDISIAEQEALALKLLSSMHSDHV